MTKRELQALRPGDCIQSELTKLNYIVTGHYKDRVTAVQSVDVTNPVEWRVVYKVRPLQDAQA
jgi:hypothetical protein